MSSARLDLVFRLAVRKPQPTPMTMTNKISPTTRIIFPRENPDDFFVALLHGYLPNLGKHDKFNAIILTHLYFPYFGGKSSAEAHSASGFPPRSDEKIRQSDRLHFVSDSQDVSIGGALCTQFLYCNTKLVFCKEIFSKSARQEEFFTSISV